MKSIDNPVVSTAPSRKVQFLRLLILLVVIGFSVYIFSMRDQATALAGYGYPGIFLLSLLASATVLLPAPGVVVVFAMGAVFDPFWVAITAGAGSALGELSGYLAGYGGQAIIGDSERYLRMVNLLRNSRYDDWIILILAFIPNPVFDLAGIAAGALKFPVIKFLFLCWIGKTAKMLLFAFAGDAFGWLLK
jgi:membrane protein YqaA with SNARE-associated domain